MAQYIVRDTTGKLYAVCPEAHHGVDNVYRQFAQDVLKMSGVWDKSFDTGNVDIDVFEIPDTSGTSPVVFDVDSE